MKHDEQIPIEPLPDSAWNRIECAVFDELDAGSHAHTDQTRRMFVPRWAALGLAALVMLQAAAAVLFVVRRDEPPKPLASTRLLTEGEASETMFGDVSIRLEPASALVVVENTAHSSLCVLERGAARFSVPHRGKRPAFLVQAGDVRVEVVGTQFRVERSAGSARVDAYAGTVRVTAQGQTRMLTHGQHWSPSVPVPSAQATAPAAVPGAAMPPAAQASTPPAAAAEASVRASERALLERQRARFEHATALEASNPDEALRTYRGLAREDGPWAENALYAEARLELDLGHHTSARRLLHGYLDRHPAGANASDARSLLRRLTRETEKADP